jgi:hypothetical protein
MVSVLVTAVRGGVGFEKQRANRTCSLGVCQPFFIIPETFTGAMYLNGGNVDNRPADSGAGSGQNQTFGKLLRPCKGRAPRWY